MLTKGFHSRVCVSIQTHPHSLVVGASRADPTGSEAFLPPARAATVVVTALLHLNASATWHERPISIRRPTPRGAGARFVHQHIYNNSRQRTSLVSTLPPVHTACMDRRRYRTARQPLTRLACHLAPCLGEEYRHFSLLGALTRGATTGDQPGCPFRPCASLHLLPTPVGEDFGCPNPAWIWAK